MASRIERSLFRSYVDFVELLVSLLVFHFAFSLYDFLFNVSSRIKLVACTSTNTQRLLWLYIYACVLLSRSHASCASMCLCGVYTYVRMCRLSFLCCTKHHTGRNLNKINDREIVKQSKMTIKWNKRISLNHSIV